ncbi:glycosyltransferase family 2 protein [uncultured Jatrophihabitans sp.]|uniref:glycosyltransferase family 2 protein n=1 Tax=uncultured Jatrophihabitans sp. TaxID=1610747 RepID=UPI0035CAD220
MPEAVAAPTPSVVIVAYRADAHLDRCLAALGPGAHVVIVDNDAAPSTKAIADEHGAEYIASLTNVGFAAAVNIGLRHVGDTDVLLLNPDARLGLGDVRRMQTALRAPGTHRAAVGPRLVGADGGAQLAQWPMPSPAQIWLDAVGLGRLWRGRTFVVGAALMLHADALTELGGLDERYFLYAEEADWQLGALHAGWQLHVVDTVTCTHVGAASSSDPVRRERLFLASGRAFARRWYGPLGAAVMRAGSLVAAVRRSLVGSAESRARNRRLLRLQLTGPPR